MAKLLVKEGPSRVTEYELTDEVKVVGRDRTNDVRINHALVSRNHAQFFRQNDTFAVRDLESKNGTFVNNTPLTPGVARPLVEGDQVRIGPTTFVFSADTPAAAAVAPAAAGAASAEKDGAGPGTRLIELNRPLFDPAKVNALEELRAGQAQLLTLLEAAKALGAAADVRGIHGTLLTMIQEQLQPQRAFLFRMSENNSALVPAGQFLAQGEAAGQPLQAARLAVAQAIRDKSGVIRSGLMSAEQTGGAADNRMQLAAPLIFNGSLLGVVYVDAREQVRPYKVHDLRLLVGLAQLSADALGNLDNKQPRGSSFTGVAIEQMRRDAALLGDGQSISAMKAFVAKAAAAAEPLLLFGPPGTGKQHMARLIHLLGPRSAGPFVVVSGPALPKSLTETELFGQEIEGATPQSGRVEWAEGGTLFIDQLQEISFAAQERLFNLISKGQFQRVGSEDVEDADVRLIVSTNVDPREFVGQRLYHQPLIQALGNSMYEVPPLAARREDIPLLAEHFLERCRHKAQRKIRGFAEDALAAIQSYAWPGNLEELHLAIHYAVFRGDARDIRLTDLPDIVRNGAGAAAVNGSATPSPAAESAAAPAADAPAPTPAPAVAPSA